MITWSNDSNILNVEPFSTLKMFCLNVKLKWLLVIKQTTNHLPLFQTSTEEQCWHEEWQHDHHNVTYIRHSKWQVLKTISNMEREFLRTYRLLESKFYAPVAIGGLCKFWAFQDVFQTRDFRDILYTHWYDINTTWSPGCNVFTCSFVGTFCTLTDIISIWYPWVQCIYLHVHLIHS